MVRVSLFFMFFLFYIQESTAQVFVIQRGEEIILHNNVNDAFTNLEANDELYLPGGEYTLNDAFFGGPCSNLGSNPIGILPDSVKIFGAGHYPEFTSVTGKTILKEYIPGHCNGSNKNGVLKLGNSNLVMGIEFSFYVYVEDNASISYCSLPFLHAQPGNNVFNVHIAKNIISRESNTGSSYGRTGIVTQNIIGGWISTGNSNMIFDSNVFLDTAYYGNGIDFIHGTNAILQNNIFLTEHTNAASLNHDPTLIYTNNIFVGANISGDVMPGSWAYEFNTNNTFFQNPNTLFENYIWGAPFSYGFDFHLSEGHIGIGADTNGENIGIYKTDDETENKIPFNPHIISKIIPSESDGNGMLNIQIEVEARQN